MILHWARKIFTGIILSKVKANVFALPEDVLNLVTNGKARALVSFIDWASQQNNAEEVFSALQRKVREENWESSEEAKLSAYFLYFSRKYQNSHDEAIKYVSPGEQKFDPDYFGIACMSLYNSNQFMKAYELLRSINEYEDVMLKDPDYLLAAMLICWSAGDRYRANRYMDLGMLNVAETGMMTFNAFAMYYELGDMRGFCRASELIDEEISALPNFQYARAFIEFAEGRYESGFKMAECRYKMPEAYLYMRKELLILPRWDKEEISDKTLLIHGEQGLGDMIQTARFFKKCSERAKKVIVECPRESIALLEFNFPQIKFLPLDFKESVSEDFDVWTGTLSLPYIFDVRADSVPDKKAYLRIPEDHMQYWHARVNELARPQAVKIGIAWSGYPGHRADQRRSIPWPMFRYMLYLHPEIDFFVTQVSVPNDNLSNLHGFTDELATLSDTAALINEMDLVISVDTSVVHIAGAIGKETWMLLPYRYEWRWGLEGEDNPWYESVKVIRQPAPGAWAPVLSKAFGRRLRDFQHVHGENNNA